MEILEKFNKEFNVQGSLKMVELENAIIDKYGSIQYFKQVPVSWTNDYNQKEEYPLRWECGTDFEWEDNKIHIDYKNIYSTREESLMGLLLDNKRKFKKLVENVYERNN